ncbi:conserved Plasmodium protein, unknown function [Plasmodium ovale wallikeri]|uniref:CERLI1-like PH domain-containing protein n=1 Tax=Plasmodium ovale wallikeri TaxID=864142 RepID=A0A1A8YL24_PLAOA|nr:conserved Plasmodium protein, unknown function [Plasmodium ovale wallikeri]
MFYLDTHNLLYVGSCFLASVCTLCVCRNRELFPHISENKPIGQLYRLLNIHKYESFNIIIQIHHINLKIGDDDNSKYIVHLKIGNRYSYTHYYKQYLNKIHIEKSQGKNNEKIEKLINQGTEHFEAIKEMDVSSTIYKNISNLAIEDKIRLFCKNLNGHLLHSNFYIKRFYNKYYFYLHFFKGKFYWCYYNEEADAKVDKNRVGYIRLEHVVNVYSDVYSHKYFYVKYRKKREKKENYLYLKTMDKDRNIWVNIIHDFIILVSNYRREKKNKRNKIKELTNVYTEGASKEEIEMNNKLSRTFSTNSMKNKYLEKKNMAETMSNVDKGEEHANETELSHIFKDMSKNMYNYSD